MQLEIIDPRMVPRISMSFGNVNEAYKFCSRCTYEFGFLLKKYKERKNRKWLNYSMEGKSGERVAGNPSKTHSKLLQVLES